MTRGAVTFGTNVVCVTANDFGSDDDDKRLRIVVSCG